MHYKTNGPSFLWPEPGHRLDFAPQPRGPSNEKCAQCCADSLSIFSCLETTAQGDPLLAVTC